MNLQELPLPEKVRTLVRGFEDAGVPYAIGGALALAYYAVPRATIDIDVNVFLPPEAIDRVSDLVAPMGVNVTMTLRRTALRDGQVRLRWGRTPIDLFFATDEFHVRAAARVRRVPFEPGYIAILAPEDLLVCKALFDRRKDWIDIEQMLLLTAGELDVAGVRRTLAGLVGDDDQRVAHYDRAVIDVLG